jgi:hypothetical protein
MHLDAGHSLPVNAGIDIPGEQVQRREIVHPETNRCLVLAGELTRQPPADAGIAEIIDDAAKDIP